MKGPLEVGEGRWEAVEYGSAAALLTFLVVADGEAMACRGFHESCLLHAQETSEAML